MRSRLGVLAACVAFGCQPGPENAVASAPIAEGAPAMISDGEISLAIPGDARACVVYPPERFVKDACPSGTSAVASPPSDGLTYLALGNFVRDGANEIVATVSVTRQNGSLAHAPAASASDPVVKGILAREHGSVSSPSLALVPRQSFSVLRIEADVNGADGPQNEHVVEYLATARERLYVIAFHSRKQDAARFGDIAGRVASTIDLAHPAPAALANDPAVTAPSAPPPSAGPPVPDADHVIAGLRSKFRRCYQRALAIDPNEQGRVVFQVHVAADGAVDSVALFDQGPTTTLSATTVGCLKAVIQNAQFSPPGAAAMLHVPITFVQADAGAP